MNQKELRATRIKRPAIDTAARETTLQSLLKGRVSDLVFRFVMVLANHGRAGRGPAARAGERAEKPRHLADGAAVEARRRRRDRHGSHRVETRE